MISKDKVRRTRTTAADIDGDGEVSPWEQNLCRLCLLAALTLAFGSRFLAYV